MSLSHGLCLSMQSHFTSFIGAHIIMNLDSMCHDCLVALFLFGFCCHSNFTSFLMCLVAGSSPIVHHCGPLSLYLGTLVHCAQGCCLFPFPQISGCCVYPGRAGGWGSFRESPLPASVEKSALLLRSSLALCSWDFGDSYGGIEGSVGFWGYSPIRSTPPKTPLILLACLPGGTSPCRGEVPSPYLRMNPQQLLWLKAHLLKE